MSISLEEAVKKIFTFDTSYEWNMECKDVTRASDLDTEELLYYRINVVVNWNSGMKENFEALFTVPKLTRGSLEVRGRRKQSIFTALGNTKIRIFDRIFAWGNGYDNSIKLDVSCRENYLKMQFPYDKDNYKFGEVLTCNFSNFLKYWNKWEPEFVYWFSKKDIVRAENSYNDDVPIIERVNKELIIPDDALLKLRFITKKPNLPNTLTPEVVDSFIYIIQNSSVLSNKPTPLDFRFLDTYEALALNLTKNFTMTKMNDIRSHVTFEMNKNNKFRATRLQAKINDFFQSIDSDYSNIQEFTDTNALSVAELNDKIFFESWNNDIKGYEKSRLDPSYFIGIVDPVFTADSNQINIKNELSTDAKIIDEKAYVTVLDKKFKEKLLDVYTYLMSGVLSSDNIDYVNKKFFPVNGKYSIYRYGEYEEVSDEKEFDYLRKEDSILTDSTSMIPFINRTQSMRSMLGAHMITQALPVSGSQPMFINTGKGRELYDKTALNLETPHDGKVVAMTDDRMKIQKTDGSSYIIAKPKAYLTANGTTTSYSPSVKIGDKVKSGQTVYECSSFKDKDFAVGVPLLVAYTSWHGREHEDAMVISKSAAAKFTHRNLEIVEVPVTTRHSWILGLSKIEKDSEVAPIVNELDEFGFRKIGSVVRKEDILFACEQIVPENTERYRIAKLLNPDSTLTELFVVKTPFEVTDGEVAKIEFIPTKGAKVNFASNLTFNTLSSHFDNLSREYYKSEAEKLGVSEKDVKQKQPEVYCSDKNVMGYIKITIMYNNYLKESDKMSNYYGSKGVVSTIVDDDKMLRTEDGRIIDIVISPLSVINRINISQLYVASLGLISKGLYERLEKFFLAGGKDKKERELLEKVVRLILYKQPNITIEEVYEKSKKYGMVTIEASAFDKYFSSENVTEALELLDIKDHQKLYDPTTGNWIRTPIRVGYQDFMRLHFIAEHKMKVTGTNKRLDIIGYGDYREKGQAIGEQESWALMSYGDLDLLHKFSHERDEKAARFSQEMLSIGLMLNSAK